MFKKEFLLKRKQQWQLDYSNQWSYSNLSKATNVPSVKTKVFCILLKSQPFCSINVASSTVPKRVWTPDPQVAGQKGYSNGQVTRVRGQLSNGRTVTATLAFLFELQFLKKQCQVHKSDYYWPDIICCSLWLSAHSTCIVVNYVHSTSFIIIFSHLSFACLPPSLKNTVFVRSRQFRFHFVLINTFKNDSAF